MFTSGLTYTLKMKESLPCFETLKVLKSWFLTLRIHSGKLSFKQYMLLAQKISLLMGFLALFFSGIFQ